MALVTVKDCAELNLGVYDQLPGGQKVTWDHYDDGSDGDGICWALKEVNGIMVVVYRGSTTFRDWIRDMLALANPFCDDRLGPVHPGFYLGMEKAYREARQVLGTTRFVVTGHSLGAGRASIAHGLWRLDGFGPAARVVFGEPKPGFAKLAAIIAPDPTWSFRCADSRGHDLVTDVPFSFPPEHYVHAEPNLIDVPASPPLLDAWGPFRYHHMSLYAAGVPDVAAVA